MKTRHRMLLFGIPVIVSCLLGAGLVWTSHYMASFLGLAVAAIAAPGYLVLLSRACVEKEPRLFGPSAALSGLVTALCCAIAYFSWGIETGLTWQPDSKAVTMFIYAALIGGSILSIGFSLLWLRRRFGGKGNSTG